MPYLGYDPTVMEELPNSYGRKKKRGSLLTNQRGLIASPELPNPREPELPIMSTIPQPEQPDAIDAYGEALTHLPTRDDYKPSIWRKLAATAAGLGAVARGENGYDTASGISEAPYKRAMGDYSVKLQGLKGAAEIQDMRAKRDIANTELGLKVNMQSHDIANKDADTWSKQVTARLNAAKDPRSEIQIMADAFRENPAQAKQFFNARYGHLSFEEQQAKQKQIDDAAMARNMTTKLGQDERTDKTLKNSMDRSLLHENREDARNTLRVNKPGLTPKISPSQQMSADHKVLNDSMNDAATRDYVIQDKNTHQIRLKSPTEVMHDLGIGASDAEQALEHIKTLLDLRLQKVKQEAMGTSDDEDGELELIEDDEAY